MQTEKNIPENHIQTLQCEFQKYKSSADFVAFKLVHEVSRDFSVRNGKPDNFFHRIDTGVMIEVMVNGHIGYSGTCELTSHGIQKALTQALESTKFCTSNSVTQFSKSIRPKNVGTYTSPRLKNLDQLSLVEIYDYLKKTSLQLKSTDKIVSASADVMLIECDHFYINSQGSEIHQNFNIVSNSFSATAQDGPESQTRTLHGGRGNCFQIGAEFLQLDQALQQCEEISKEALLLLTAKNCPTTTCDLILAPDQMLLQIHESIGHPLELDRILGDERNYAGWSFIQPEDFGSLQYGSPKMNVVFDPTEKNEMASYAFDESGAKAEKKYLIQNGLLVAGLGGLESQERSKISGVSNMRSSSWNRAPIDRMANINLEGGQLTLDQMISKVENGVIMHSNRSWSIDDYRRKFQFGCELAYEIKDGKLGQLLKNPNYRGTTVPFWNSLVDLTNHSTIETYGSPYCGKGEPSQVIRVGHSSPYALFKNIEIFGGS